jgi:hypothetical protein
MIPDTKALKTADYEDYWPVDNQKLPNSTQEDQYPGYSGE